MLCQMMSQEGPHVLDAAAEGTHRQLVDADTPVREVAGFVEKTFGHGDLTDSKETGTYPKRFM